MKGNAPPCSNVVRTSFPAFDWDSPIHHGLEAPKAELTPHDSGREEKATHTRKELGNDDQDVPTLLQSCAPLPFRLEKCWRFLRPASIQTND